MPSGSPTQRFFFNDQEAFMTPEQRPHLDSQHQPETVSTANRQTFEDPDGGLPLDSPLVQARTGQQRGRPARLRPAPAEQDSSDDV
jgi:hypothetical protein